MHKFKVFIDGSYGTTGLKISEYLSNRADISLLKITENRKKDIGERLHKISESDIAFLCLPDTAAKEIVPLIPDACRVIDTSTAHRVNQEWVYGMPELDKNRRAQISESNRVANPGCHASGFILAVKPLIASGILSKDALLTVTSLTGYSGGGKNMIADYEHQPNAEFVSGAQYGLNQNHKHLPEMVTMTGIQKAPTFMPIVCNYYSGMEVSVPLHGEMFNGPITINSLYEILRDYYNESPLIKVTRATPKEGFIYSNKLANTNMVYIYIYGNDDRPVITSLYDNLGKGASGAAVQNMNIMLGLDETTGLIKEAKID